MDLQTTHQTPVSTQQPSRPIAVWLIAIATWIALCVFTIRADKLDVTQFLVNFLIANFQSLPGLLFTTLARYRKSAYLRWNIATIIVQIPGLILWIAHAFEPTLTGGVTGPMAGFTLLPFILVGYILGAFGIFFLVAIPDVVGRLKPNERDI